MDAKSHGPGPQRVPLPSIHLHPSLSTASRHPQSSTRLTSPHEAQSARSFNPRPSPSSLTSACRTTSRPSTASSIDENSEDESTSRHSNRRHHPYQAPSNRNRPQLSISPSASRRSSIYSPYSQSNDDMGTFLRAGTSASASADEGSNSNSYYDGDSRGASMSPLMTASPSFTFVGQRHDREMTDGHKPSGSRASAGTDGGSQSTAPLSLDSLPSYPPDQKPPFSYPVLIRLAILGSPQKRLLLSQIYSAIEDKFPWYRDSAPKAWKASVRHCLSLNKEFVRMQRAVEDPGVGCGGWWSVGEGMKGLKRPRKRRPAQSKRDHEQEQAQADRAPVPLSIRRRHSATFDDTPRVEPYPRYISPFSSSSVPPSIASVKLEYQTKSAIQDGMMDMALPPVEDYSVRLPPLQIPNPAQPLPTPPSSSRTVIFGNLSAAANGYPHDYSLNTNYKGARGSHTPTASSSSSYSTQSFGSASTSASSGSRPNPMSISSLLNGDRHSSIVTGGILDAFDKMDVDTEDVRGQSQSTTTQKKKDRDVEMRTGKVTPFSSDQTLRPPSPDEDQPRSHGRRSTTPVAPTDQRQRTQYKVTSSRPTSHARAGPPRPTRPPPPLPVEDSSATRRAARSARSSRGDD